MLHMNAVNIRKLDLNLLVVFEAVMQTRSLTAAAARLGQSQPTVSHALARLRRACGDTLFVRGRRGVQPTPYAERLAVPVGHALDLIRGSLSRSDAFDPASSERSFTLLMSDVGQASFLPPLLRRLAQAAPHVRLTAGLIPRDRYREALETGRADLAIGALPFLQSGFYRRRLFADRYVCVVCASHPAATAGTLSLEAYLQGRHVGIISPGLPDDGVDSALLQAGQARDIAVRVPTFLVAPGLVPGTDLIATVPSRVLRVLPERDRIRVLPAPISTTPLVVHQHWHERLHQDAGNRWLRGLIAELFTDRAGDAPPEPPPAPRRRGRRA